MVDRPPTEHLDLADPGAYGRSFADVYDHWYHDVTDAEATADFVAARCHGPVLELGVGSGRLALPLAARGLPVVGLDGSADMLNRGQRLGRADEDAAPADITLVNADMRRLPFPNRPPHRHPDRGHVGAVLIAFNTIFNLTSAQDQAQLFHDLQALLTPTGALIIEAMDLSAVADGPTTTIGARDVEQDRLVVTATAVDHQDQTITGQHLEISDHAVTVRPWKLRWLTPLQLDDLAVNAGFSLAERYRSWTGDPFDAEAETHVTVYRAGPDPPPR